MMQGGRTIGSKIKPTHSLDNWGWVSTRPSILETNHSAVTPTTAASRAMTIWYQHRFSPSHTRHHLYELPLGLTTVAVILIWGTSSSSSSLGTTLDPLPSPEGDPSEWVELLSKSSVIPCFRFRLYLILRLIFNFSFTWSLSSGG